MKFNTLASPTYSWLKMNGGELLDLPAMERLSPAIELPEGVRVEKLNGVAAKPRRTRGGGVCGGRGVPPTPGKRYAISSRRCRPR